MNINIINDLQKTFTEHHFAIDEWFQKQWQHRPPFVYGSVDLRHAGVKLAPVDMNLFPAGFNHLNEDAITQSIIAANQSIQHAYPKTKKILLIPENHTRNGFYWENIAILCNILEQAHYQVRITSIDTSVLPPQSITYGNKKILQIEPLIRRAQSIQLNDFIPDLILLNNDLSDGIPACLKDLEQSITPPLMLGWNTRLKSSHFQHYTHVVEEFASLLKIDPWLIMPLSHVCDTIDFHNATSIEMMQTIVSELLYQIKKKYDHYQITHAPFLMIKANAGTYGMAVMTVRDPAQLKQLNRKQRAHMMMTKGKKRVNSVIIQEGIPTVDTIGIDRAISEPVLYLWGEHVVGGFYRSHSTRQIDENLNTPGMHFQAFSIHDDIPQDAIKNTPCLSSSAFNVYRIIAKLSMLAATREINRDL